MFELFLNLTKN